MSLSFFYFLWYSVSAVLYAVGILWNAEGQATTETENDSFTSFSSFGGKAKFLTHINMFLQSVYCSIAGLWLLTRMIQAESRILRKLMNFMSTSLTFPVGANVVFAFWALYLIDRDLIFPVSMERFVPPWRNHLMHTFPLVSALFDSFIVRKTYHKSFLRGYMTTFLFSLGYLVWVLIIAYHAQFWVYPFMKYLGPVELSLFFVVSFVISAVFYQLGYLVDRIIWGSSDKKVN